MERYSFNEILLGVEIKLPCNGYVSPEVFEDLKKNKLHLIKIFNGALLFTVILERAMDIGEIFYKGEKVSWNRSKARLLHPDSVDIHKEGAWEDGFYQCVASLGPEVFGTPDEIRTPHGTSAFSMANPDSVYITVDKDKVSIEGLVDIKGYSSESQYSKLVNITTSANSCFFIREETYKNLTGERLPIDDGYHIQLCGDFIKDGGRYVLPVATNKMLLRDSVPSELNPKAVYPVSDEFMPIRCYQYVPEKVYGIEGLKEFKGVDFLYKEPENTTAEMLLNKQGTKASIVVRPLSSFKRTLLAKRNDGEAMYAIEPSKTRPNSIRQKAIDGELEYLEPCESRVTCLLIGFLDNKDSIDRLKNKIESAAAYEEEIAKIRRKEK